MKILSIIPARGGSKGIKLKNLAKIDDKPLVAFSIEHSLASKLINRTIVSTENEEIAKISKKYGAEIPILRSNDLADDHVLDLPVFEHMLSYLKQKENYVPEIVVHLRPTSPFRKAKWIDSAIRLLIENTSADSVRSVSEPSQHPYRIFEIKDKYLISIMNKRHPEPYLLRRQDLPKMYYYNCVIDVTRSSTIFKKKSMTGSKMLPYIMKTEDSIDIDTEMDLEFAKILLKGRL